jgi:hypothetical protein
MKKVGKDGVIIVEESKTMETTLEVVEGMQFDCGYLSPYFVTDSEWMHCSLEGVHILICEKNLPSMKDLLPVLEMVAKLGQPQLIVAEDVEGEALATLVVNKLRGTLKFVAVKAPGFGDRRKAMLEDIAILTGGKAITVPTPFTCFSRASSGCTSLAICSIRRSHSAMRSFHDSIPPNSGSKASRNSWLSPLQLSRFICSVPHFRSRSPYDFVNPRAAFTSAVRVLTSTVRARITLRWICALAVRCRTGPNKPGSILASRASVRASSRSSFRLLSPISRTFRA